MSQIGSRSKGVGWYIMYAFTLFIDLLQIFLTPTGIGIVLNEYIEAAMPFIMVFVFQFLIKASIITKPARLASIAGALGLGAITGGIAPFWIVDVWYIHRSVKKEDAEYQSQNSEQERLSNNVRQALYQDGVRQPQRQQPQNETPRNVDGIRAPRGGLN